MNLSDIKFIPSPNFQPRGSNVPQIIVLHCPVGTMQGCIATFENRQSKVSAHYVVDRDGTIVQMVDLANAAWHAMHYPNMIGIGIEMVDKYMVGGYPTRGCMADPQWFATLQLAAVAELVAALMTKFNIPLNKVMGHNDAWLKQFGNNHQDPGPYFPWVNFKVLVQKALQVNALVQADETGHLDLNAELIRKGQQCLLDAGIPEPHYLITDSKKPSVQLPPMQQTKLDIPLTAPRPDKPRKKRGRRLIKPPRRNRIYE